MIDDPKYIRNVNTTETRAWYVGKASLTTPIFVPTAIDGSQKVVFHDLTKHKSVVKKQTLFCQKLDPNPTIVQAVLRVNVLMYSQVI